MTQGGEREGEEKNDPPEVEAELVGETAAATDAFDDEAPAAPADASPDEAEADEEPERRPPALTPGVILFIVFAVAALSVFAFWRFQAGGASEDAETAAPQEGARAPAESRASPPQPETAEPETTVAPPEEAPEAAGDIAGKIVNAPADAKPDSASEPADDSFLPPVTEAGAQKLANPVEDGAKEAMRRFQEAEDAAAVAAPSDEAPQSAEDIDGFDVETPQTGAQSGDPDTDDVESREAAMETELEIAESVQPETSPDAGAENHASDAPAGPSATATETAAASQAEVARLETVIADLRQRNDDQAAEIDRLRADLAAAVSESDQRLQVANAEIASLRAELNTARTAGSARAAQQIGMTLALASLELTIASGAPYAGELDALAGADPQALAALGVHAQTGVATDAALRDRFDAAARGALAAAGQDAAEGWFSGLAARAQSLVSVRPADPIAGDSPGAVLSRAEHALEAGDVAAALSELEGLPSPAQTAMADWIEAARARAEIEAALNALRASLNGRGG